MSMTPSETYVCLSPLSETVQASLKKQLYFTNAEYEKGLC